MNSKVSKLHNLHQVVKSCQMIVCQRTHGKKFGDEFITEAKRFQPGSSQRTKVGKHFMRKVILAKGCQVLIRLSEIARGSVSLHQLVVPVDGVSWSSFFVWSSRSRMVVVVVVVAFIKRDEIQAKSDQVLPITLLTTKTCSIQPYTWAHNLQRALAIQARGTRSYYQFDIARWNFQQGTRTRDTQTKE